MTDVRWQQVKVLCQATVELPLAERSAFLAAATGSDEALRQQVESLLSSDEEAASSLDRLPLAAAGVLGGVPDLSASLEDIVHIVCHTEGTPPSVARRALNASSTVSFRAARELKGDLDTIVLKALRKEPERRYLSAQAPLSLHRVTRIAPLLRVCACRDAGRDRPGSGA